METLETPVATFDNRGYLLVDIDWSSKLKYLLATASVSKAVNVWDFRMTSQGKGVKPAMSNQSTAYPSHVRWNKVDQHIVTSCHDTCVKIWDTRNFRVPVLNKIVHKGSVSCVDEHFFSSIDEHFLLLAKAHFSTNTFHQHKLPYVPLIDKRFLSLSFVN